MGDTHTFDFVGVTAGLWPKDSELQPRFLERFERFKYVLWVTDAGKILDLEQMKTMLGEDMVLPVDVFEFRFRPIGEQASDSSGFFGNISFLVNCRHEQDVFGEFLVELIEITRKKREGLGDWGVIYDSISFVTLWEYYGTTHYTEDGNEVDDYWQLIGVVDTDRAKEITQVIEGVEPWE